LVDGSSECNPIGRGRCFVVVVVAERDVGRGQISDNWFRERWFDETTKTFRLSRAAHCPLPATVATSWPGSPVPSDMGGEEEDEDDEENSVTRRASGLVLFSSSMAETRAPPPDALLPFFCSSAMKVSLRELDLWPEPKVMERMSALAEVPPVPPAVAEAAACLTGETRFWRLPNESVGSFLPRTFLLDLEEEEEEGEEKEGREGGVRVGWRKRRGERRRGEGRMEEEERGEKEG